MSIIPRGFTASGYQNRDAMALNSVGAHPHQQLIRQVEQASNAGAWGMPTQNQARMGLVDSQRGQMSADETVQLHIAQILAGQNPEFIQNMSSMGLADPRGGSYGM